MICISPVSYTHLDVYKRQVVEDAMATEPRKTQASTLNVELTSKISRSFLTRLSEKQLSLIWEFL